MNKSWISCLLLAGASTVHAASPLPSEIMRRLPSIPDPVQAKDCAAAEPLLSEVEQLGRAGMMRAQQMAMSGARSGRASDADGELIARLLDPEVTGCEANVQQAFTGRDPAGEFRQALEAIQAETRQEIASSCPVIGSADYRDEKCVNPILQRHLQEERSAISNYIVAANSTLAAEIDAYAQCAATHEKLAAEVEAAALLPQYASIAFNGKARGWQQAGVLAERYRQLCDTAADATADVANRERDF